MTVSSGATAEYAIAMEAVKRLRNAMLSALTTLAIKAETSY
jgi:hypothetical protein